MKKDCNCIWPRDLAASFALADRPQISQQSGFPSYERLFSAFVREAAFQIRAIFSPRGSHTIVTFTLRPSTFGVN